MFDNDCSLLNWPDETEELMGFDFIEFMEPDRYPEDCLFADGPLEVSGLDCQGTTRSGTIDCDDVFSGDVAW